MSYKEITVYTPTGSEPHIAAEDDAFIYDSLTGGRSGILGGLSCARMDDNTVRLSGGGVVNKGYVMYVPAGCTHELSISNGSQGESRHDLIVSRFTRGGGNAADSNVFAVVSGTPASLPSDPSLTTSGLAAAGDVNETALFRVVIDGLSITSVEQVAQDVGQTSLSYNAEKLQTARTIALTGDASGSASFDGSADISIAATVSRICGAKVTISETAPLNPSEGDLWICYGE